MAPGDERPSPSWQGSLRADSAPVAASQSQARRNDESWVEIASQPSSSSLSSIGDEIVTTGLRVGDSRLPPQPQQRRRLLQQVEAAQMRHANTAVRRRPSSMAGASSQEEYDETESEEDRVLTSSTENVQHSPSLLQRRAATTIGAVSDSEDDDDDDKATALAMAPSSPTTFRPQPNAFSHPPSHLQQRSHSASSSIPQHHPPYGRPSMSQRSQTRPQRSGPNFMSPNYREDNEAALRASLTTLLSCAAAARGLPKKDDASIAGPSGTGAGIRPSTQPMDLRFVQESELMAEATGSSPAAGRGSRPEPTPSSRAARKGQARTASNSSAPSAPASTSSRDGEAAAAAAAEKSRRSSVATASQKPARATKKKRTASSAAAAAAAAGVDADTTPFTISPSVLTWVVSAGVVVLVSVVTFGAGFVYGREVGRQEAAMGVGSGGAGGVSNATSSCGREIARSSGGGTLRRLRWGSMAARSVAA